MTSYQCGLCSYIYDPAKEGTDWPDLPDDWVCPVCGSGKGEFKPIPDEKSPPPAAPGDAEPEIRSSPLSLRPTRF